MKTKVPLGGTDTRRAAAVERDGDTPLKSTIGSGSTWAQAVGAEERLVLSRRREQARHRPSIA